MYRCKSCGVLRDFQPQLSEVCETCWSNQGWERITVETAKEPLPMIRQGDVLLIKVAEIPESAKPVKRDNGRLVLAHGEATGHAHVIDSPPEEAVLLTDKENRRFLNLVRDSVLKHEEHTNLHVPAGKYQQIPQREWVDSMNQAEPDRGEVRPVFD